VPDPLADLVAASIGVSVTPIFLLVAIGAFLNVLTQRLGRVVDRARRLQETDESADAAELAALDRRMAHGNRAVFLCCCSALAVCATTGLIFAARLGAPLAARGAGFLFVAAILMLIAGLVSFLRETAIAVQTLRVRTRALADDAD